jgi:hypothetical protein
VTPPAKRLAVALVGVLLTLPLNSAAASTSAVARTTVVMFPWQQNGQLAPQVHIGPRLSGYCWVGAFPGPEDEYAWRCLVGNSILTPCYSPLSQHVREVVCAVTPWWAFKVPLIRLQKPLPAGQADKGGYWSAWAIQLSNKGRCILANPGSPPISGGAAPYTCGNGYLASDLNPGSQPWTVDYWSNSSEFGGPPSHLSVVTVSVAYDGPD